MTMRQTQKYETPESNLKNRTNTSSYPKEFLDKQVDILLGLIAGRLPLIGISICEELFAKPIFKEVLKKRLVEYYTEMHQETFHSLKAIIRSSMTKEDFPISLETMKGLVEGLEKDYGQALPELGIEPQEVLLPFCKNQMIWYNNNFKFNEE